MRGTVSRRELSDSLRLSDSDRTVETVPPGTDTLQTVREWPWRDCEGRSVEGADGQSPTVRQRQDGRRPSSRDRHSPTVRHGRGAIARTVSRGSGRTVLRLSDSDRTVGRPSPPGTDTSDCPPVAVARSRRTVSRGERTDSLRLSDSDRTVGDRPSREKGHWQVPVALFDRYRSAQHKVRA
jgi:hypothetical protein